MKLFSRLFAPSSEALDEARREGARQVRDSLLSELNYVIGDLALHREADRGMSDKWAQAFDLMFAPRGGARHPRDLPQQLQQLGFTDTEVEFMVTRLRKHPEIIMVQVFAAMTGRPDGDVWGITYR